MDRVAFIMKLKPGFEREYEKRHDEIWPELQTLIKSKGIEDYSIFLDEKSLNLFGTLKISDRKLLHELPNEAVMKRWWSYMKDIMETNSDNSPLSIPLKEVFYLP